LIFFMLSGPVNVVAQLGTTIIIDTLLGYNDDLVHKYDNEYLWLFMGECDHPYVINEKFPNVIMTYNDTCDLLLLLDDKGGAATLKNLNFFDTIHIKKWMVYKNGLADSIDGSRVYYRYYNDSLVSGPHKKRVLNKYNLNTGISDLKEISIIVNNIPVTVKVGTDTTIFITNSHGYKSRRIHRKAMKGWRSDKIVKHLRFATGYDKKVFTFNTEIDFKHFSGQ
jgi:hypothetical protein